MRGRSGHSGKRRDRTAAEAARRSPLLWGVIIVGIVVFVLIYLFDSPSASTARSSDVYVNIGLSAAGPGASRTRLVMAGRRGSGRG